MLSLQQASLHRGNKILLENSTVNLYEKQKIGLVGHNGCGKSSLFALILGKLALEAGELQLNPQLRIAHLSQQLPESAQGALEFVLHGDTQYSQLIAKLAKAEAKEDHAGVLHCHEELTQTGGYAKPAQAASIMSGLGFNSTDQQKPVNSFSGGWRMRLSLARCLMKPADLILLDEPTNHLDMEAIVWLEKYLKQSPATILLISHDRDFLDGFVSHILHLHQKTLTLYSGDYSAFEQIRAEQLTLQQASYEKQQQKIAHLMSFVTRFKAKATKAKQAQSRLNTIHKMEKVAQAQFDSPFSFSFFPCPRAGNPLIRCDEMAAGYQTAKAILKTVNLILNPGDRIALLGPNGMGKSTLIKTLIGELPTLTGTIHHHSHLKIGYYAQHQLDALDLGLSPIATIQSLSPDAREQTIRDFLGGFDFRDTMAESPATHFSGGEKARLALAKLVWQAPNILLLDEPTNHLDLGMRAAIEIALQSFEGALVIISHDRHLLNSCADAFYLVYNGNVEPFKGDLDDYYQWMQEMERTSNPQSGNSPSGADDFKNRKRLQNRLKKLDSELEVLQKKRHAVQSQLADVNLYTEKQSHRLAELQQQESLISHQLAESENEWLEVLEQLDEHC